MKARVNSQTPKSAWELKMLSIHLKGGVTSLVQA